jgi:hypothetical protein
MIDPRLARRRLAASWSRLARSFRLPVVVAAVGASADFPVTGPRRWPSLPLATATVAGLTAVLLLANVVGERGWLPPAPAAPSPVLLAALADPALLPEPAAGPADQAAAGPGEVSQSAPASPGGSALPVVPDVPAELDDIARELQRRRAEVLELEAALAVREAALRAAEADLSAQIDRLEAFQRRLEVLVGEAEAEEEERLQQLVKMYESMRAKSAAAIFDRLDMAVILAVATRMREARMAAILAAMDPNRARLVTSELARERELPRLD